MGSIISFYSYKGGVGRTMSLANVASVLASRGHRVLAVDWDLEAPGLHHYFPGAVRSGMPRGIIHLMDLALCSEATTLEWSSLTRPCMGRQFHLDLLSSGIGVEGYEQLVLSFDWMDFYREGGDKVLESLRDAWLSEYDFVLIDSRTGLTDSGGICTIFMPDILILVVTANQQSLDGAKYLSNRVESSRQRLRFSRAPLMLLPLVSRWDGREEHQESQLWFERITETLGNTVDSWLPSTVSKAQLFAALRVPHVAYFSFGEKLPVLTHSLSDPELPGRYYANLADAIEALADPDAKIEEILDLRKTPKNALRVFLSYVSREMKAFAYVAREVLRRNGYEVISQEDFLPNSNPIADATQEIMSSADLVVFLIGFDEGAFMPNGDSETFLEYAVSVARMLNLPRYTFMLMDDSHDEGEFRLRERIRGDNSLYTVFHSAPELAKLISQITYSRPINLPFPSIGAMFKGRDEFLQRLRTSLQSSRKHLATAISGKAVLGLGGVGKTRLAVEYAWQHANEYSAVLCVTADSPANLKRNLAELTGPLVLDLAEKSATELEVRVAAALRWLNQHPGWLLILDNVDTVEAVEAVEQLLAYLRGGQVLITSRLADWGSGVESLSLDVLSEPAAEALLLERTNGKRQTKASDNADARALAKDLGQLPLALEQAGAFICEHWMSISQYHDEWRTHDKDVLEWHDQRAMKYPRSVAATWETSVSRFSEETRGLMRVLCWLAPDPIPLTMLEKLTTEEGELPIRVRYAIAELVKYSFLKKSENNTQVTMHRLVQEISEYRIPDAEKQPWLTRTLRMVNAFVPEEPSCYDLRSWPEIYLPAQNHIASLVKFADQLSGKAIASGSSLERLVAPTTRLMSCLAGFHHTRANYTQAEPLMRRALAIDEQSYGAEHSLVALRLNNLATLLKAMNRLAEAEPLMARVVTIFEKSYGEHHPNVATALNNLAQLLQATNRLAEAEPLMRRALAIDEQSYGAEHPSVAIDLNNLAQLLQATNRLAEAEPLMHRALAIDERSYGAEHPNVAIHLNNLAQVFQSTNRLSEAEPLMRRVLAIYEQSFGADHPNVATALNNLGQLLQATNRLAEAEPLMRRSLAILEASFGSEHPAVATGSNNLAQLLVATNRLQEAEPFLRRALSIDEQTYGTKHPSVAIRLNNLGQLLEATQRLDVAIPLYRRAISIFQDTLGTEHPSVLTLVRQYESLLGSLGIDQRDIATRMSALAVRENVASRTILLSAVSSEFGDLRQRLAALLHRTRRLYVRHQDDFAYRGVKTLQRLEEEVIASALVIHVIGKELGWCPPLEQVEELLHRHPSFVERFPEFVTLAKEGNVSATQWEAWLALYFHQRLVIYEVSDRLEPRGCQQQHLQLLKAFDQYPMLVASDEALFDEIILSLLHLGLQKQEANDSH